MTNNLQKFCWCGRLQRILKQSHYVRCLAPELLCNSLCCPWTKSLKTPGVSVVLMLITNLKQIAQYKHNCELTLWEVLLTSWIILTGTVVCQFMQFWVDISKFSFYLQVVFGRAVTCDIRLYSEFISRRHAVINCNNGRVDITDLQVCNPTTCSNDFFNDGLL